MPSMSAMWLIVALSLVGAVVAILALSRLTGHPKDLGAVSHQWIAEHQFGADQDVRR